MGCAQKVSAPESFAQCLTDSGAIMYGTEWCSHCQNQKMLFGNSFKLINYVDCDKDRASCDRAGVEGFPTWNIKGENYPGEQNLYTLASLSGCDLDV